MKNVVWVLTMCVMSALAGCDDLEAVVLRPSSTIRLTPADFGFDFDTLSLPRENGDMVSIWHVPSPEARKGTLVVVPGNDANKSRFASALPIFSDNGWDVILMDYPGFGESTGEATFEGLIDGTRIVFEYALGQDDTVVGMGASLGTTVLARVAADLDLTACIFESTLNLQEASTLFADHHGIGSPLFEVGDLITTLSTPQDYDMKHWITRVEEPKLFLHSPGDNFTPFEGAWEIFDLAPEPKHLFVTQGDHALQVFLDPVLYRSVVNGWLDGVIGHDPIVNAQFQEILQDEIDAALDAFAELQFFAGL